MSDTTVDASPRLTADEFYDWSPLSTRVPFAWGNGAHVVFAPVIVVEHYEENPPEGSVKAADVYGGVGRGWDSNPQVTRISNRQYGHRVGFFRLADYFDSIGIKPSVAIDAQSAELYPQIVERAKAGGYEFIAHGIAITQAITVGMSVADETAYIAESKARIEAATGVAVTGWYGPSGSESLSTLGLVANAGFTYCLDWPNDEQPTLFSTTMPLVNLPMLVELDDNYAIIGRGLRSQDYAQMVVDTATRLATDGATSGKFMGMFIHPWVSGQPARFADLRRAINTIVGIGGLVALQPRELLPLRAQ